jgi:hypothetical protein
LQERPDSIDAEILKDDYSGREQLGAAIESLLASGRPCEIGGHLRKKGLGVYHIDEGIEDLRVFGSDFR